jgi:signal transduction histidine kinase
MLAVAVGVGLAWWLQPVLDPSVMLLMSVLVAAWFSGFWPAMFASVLATLAVDYFFTQPLYTINVELAHVPRLIVFTLVAGLFVSVSAARRRAEQSLRKAHDELDVKVRERTAELEELAGRLIHAQEQERSRIGRELHDHISQMLGVLTIRLDQLRAEETTPPSVAAVLGELREHTAEVTDDIHGLSHRLHSSALDYLGLVPALHKLVNEFAARHGIEVQFTHDAMPAPLPSTVALSLFRVAEESLTNVVKHSRAASAQVRVSGDADGISLSIRDDGRGFDPSALESGSGLGFVSMRERLRTLRGTVRLDSAPGHGTTIEVRVPAASIAAATREAEPDAAMARNLGVA